jgi:limonene-1,2-epoxide hydrolase
MSDVTTMPRRDSQIWRRVGDGLWSLDLVGALEVCDATMVPWRDNEA